MKSTDLIRIRTAMIEARERTNSGPARLDRPVGIENLKNTITWAIGSFLEGRTVLADNKVTFMEKIGLVDNLFEAGAVAGKALAVINEITDLDDQEIEQIDRLIRSEFPDQANTAPDWIIWSIERIADMARGWTHAQAILNS